MWPETPVVPGAPEFRHLNPKEVNVARNRYGWEKRAKEIARKQKREEKIKKRQNRAASEPKQEAPEAQEEVTSEE
jgi:predicted RNA-binding protein